MTHLHNDTVPTVGGDTLWASGYSAYEKLSPLFRQFIDGKTAIYRSAHPYLDRKNPEAGPKYVEREHPIVRVHPATGWKALWVNRAMTSRIVGLDKAESDVVLGYLFDVYEKNPDIQVRFKWSPRTSALWDNRLVFTPDGQSSIIIATNGNSPVVLTVNRITIHNASWDYEGSQPRHGTRVTSLAEKPVFDPNAPTRREKLGFLGQEEIDELVSLKELSLK